MSGCSIAGNGAKDRMISRLSARVTSVRPEVGWCWSSILCKLSLLHYLVSALKRPLVVKNSIL
jgi:hypothetical protein